MKNHTLFMVSFVCVTLLVVNAILRQQSTETAPNIAIQTHESLNIPFPAFSIPSLTEPDTMLEQSVIKGDKKLVNLWATWCPTCYAEHKYLNKLNKQGINLIGVNYKDSPDKALSWLKVHNNPYQSVINDRDGILGEKLNVYGAPVTFFVNSKGIIEYQHIGAINESLWNTKLKQIHDTMK